MIAKKAWQEHSWFDICIRYLAFIVIGFAFFFLFFGRSSKEILNHDEIHEMHIPKQFSKHCIPITHSNESVYELSAQLQKKALELNITTITAAEIGDPRCMFVSNVFTKNKEFLFYLNPKILTADGLTYVNAKHPLCEFSNPREKYYMRVSIDYADRKLNQLSDKCSTSKCRIEVVQAINILSGTFQCPTE